SRCSSCSPPPLFFLTCPPPPASTLFPYTTLFRSGGARSIRSQYYPATASSAPFFIVYLTIDTQEAMGANMMNTMLEALKAHILGQVDFIANIDGLMAILSNYAVEATATATCEITAHLLDKGPIS